MKRKIFRILILVLSFIIMFMPFVFAETMEGTISFSSASDYSDGQANPIQNVIRVVISIGQIVLPIIAIILLVKAIMIFKKQKESKGKGVVFVVLSVISFFAAGCLSVIKSFKPVIYLYPEDEEDVTVKLGKSEKLTCTYPEYKDCWKVHAKPNGDLVEIETGRNLYSLYWEGKNNVKHDLTEGFIVEGKDISKFLEEKLKVLGLNSREKEEFIIFWLPQLEKNKYNFIRFETMEQIEEDMPLEINPTPDTIIRVMMVCKNILVPYEVKEQTLVKAERKGFTVVEWGGTII